MRVLWVAPPGVLIAGCIGVVVQVRRIAGQRSLLAVAVRDLSAERDGLARLTGAIDRTRASLDGLERR